MENADALTAAAALTPESVCPTCGRRLIFTPGYDVTGSQPVRAILADPGVLTGDEAGLSWALYPSEADGRAAYAAHLREHEPKQQPPLEPGRKPHLDLDGAHGRRAQAVQNYEPLFLREPHVLTVPNGVQVRDVDGSPVQPDAPGGNVFTLLEGVWYVSNVAGVGLVPVNDTSQPDDVPVAGV